MKKKLASLLLAAAMAVSVILTGCGEVAPAAAGTENAAEAGEEAEAPASGDAYAQAIADRKAAYEESGEYTKVVFSFPYSGTATPEGITRIQEKMNEIFRERLGLEIELLVLDSAAYQQNAKLMLASGEQLDWYNSNPLDYAAVVNDDYCYDLEENDLIQTYGQGILETMDPDLIKASRVSGVLYGLPQQRDYAIMTFNMCIGKEYLDGIGYEYEEDPDAEVVWSTEEEIDEIFAQLHEAYPDLWVVNAPFNTINQGSIVDNVGGDFYGVLLDPANSLKVENLYTSDIFKQRCEMTYRWNQAGYINPDDLTDTTGGFARIKAGSVMAGLCQGKPGFKSQISAESGREMIVFQVGETIMKSGAVTGILWNMNQSCEDPVAAMQLMNELYIDPELSNLLIWGEEGVEYVLTEDGHATFPEGLNNENTQWKTTMNWMMPNQFIAHVWEGDALDLWDKMETYNTNSSKSKALGFTWDNSEYAAEYTAIQNVYEEYYKQVYGGFVDPAVGIPEMEAKMEEAGLLEYIEAKQAALDEWAAANGIE